MRRALYGGSFDPVTHGHIWMIERGSELFDEMIVVIGENPSKSYTFSLEDRLSMLRESTVHLPRTRIMAFKNQFLVDFATQHNANFLLRGIRESADYEFERKMRYINADVAPGVNTIFLMPPREIAEISSTMVKSLVGPAGWHDIVRQYVPEPVFKRLVQLQSSISPA